MIVLLMRYFKDTKIVQYLLRYRLIKGYYNFLEKNIVENRKYNEKEHRLFSQSFIGYWITKSNLSVICRMIAIGSVFISTILSKISVTIGYYTTFFLTLHLIAITFAMFVFGLYLPISLFLTIKHTKSLCSNSHVTLWGCINYTTRVCLRMAGVAAFGMGIVPVDWTFEKAGLKPVFMWAYYPGLKRLAGEVTQELGSQPSKELGFINKKIPGSSFVHKLQEQTDLAELKLAEEYKLQQELKSKRG